MEFIAAKEAEPVLSVKEWCKRVGLSYGSMKRLVCPLVETAWEGVLRRARRQVEKQLGERLGDRVANAMKAHEALLGQTMELVVQREKGVPARLVPATYQQAVQGIMASTAGYLGAVRVLTGGSPLEPLEEVPNNILWTPPLENRRRARSASRGSTGKPKLTTSGSGTAAS